MNKPFYKSKKWWAAMFALAATVATTVAGVEGVTPRLALILTIVSLVAYQVSQGMADFGKEAKGE